MFALLSFCCLPSEWEKSHKSFCAADYLTSNFVHALVSNVFTLMQTRFCFHCVAVEGTLYLERGPVVVGWFTSHPGSAVTSGSTRDIMNNSREPISMIDSELQHIHGVNCSKMSFLHPVRWAVPGFRCLEQLAALRQVVRMHSERSFTRCFPVCFWAINPEEIFQTGGEFPLSVTIKKLNWMCLRPVLPAHCIVDDAQEGK